MSDSPPLLIGKKVALFVAVHTAAWEHEMKCINSEKN